MSRAMIKHLMRKDIHLTHRLMWLFLALALGALVLMTLEIPMAFYAGVVLLLSMVIVASIHMVIATVTNESSENTRAFVLSLPLTPMQYTWAKIGVNLLVFGAFWLCVLLVLMAVLFTVPSLPNGLAVYATVLMLELFTVFVLLLAVALITDSQKWTVVVMSVCNIGLSIFMFWLSSLEGIKAHMEGPQPVWNGTAWALIGGEVLFMLALLAATLWVVSRRRDVLR